MNDGWVKLHRKVLQNDIRRFDHTAWYVFETLLLLVDRKTGVWKGGRFQLSAICGDMNPGTLYSALKRLEKAKMATLSSNNKYTTFSICRWEEYQDTSNTNQQQPSNNTATTEQHSNKKKEVRSKNNNVESLSRLQPLHDQICSIFSKNPNLYKLSEARKKQLKVRLKDTGEENIIKACTSLSRSSFHMGDNDRSWVADPYWCIKSLEKAEEWSNKYESSGYKGKLSEMEI